MLCSLCLPDLQTIRAKTRWDTELKSVFITKTVLTNFRQMNLKFPLPPGQCCFFTWKLIQQVCFGPKNIDSTLNWGRGGMKISISMENLKSVSRVLARIVWKHYLGVARTYLVIRGYFFMALLRLITFIPTQLFVKYLFLSMSPAWFVHLFVNFATTQFIDVSGQNMYILLLFANYPVYIHIIMHRNRKIHL